MSFSLNIKIKILKNDIPDRKVRDIGIAIVPRKEDELWDTYIINYKEVEISCLLINSKGYGEVDGDMVKTTILRHYIENLPALSYVKIEPIQTELFKLTNEYWVSFYCDDYMYDKKFIFVRGSIDKSNFSHIEMLNEVGVMIR